MERWLRIQDTCGVHNLHGLPGIYSAIASVLVAVTATISTYGNAYGLSGVFGGRFDEQFNEVRTAGIQAGFQAALLASTLIISISGGLLAGFLARFLAGSCKVHKREFFDDKPFWDLPDDADFYLPDEERDANVRASTSNPIAELETDIPLQQIERKNKAEKGE